SSALPQAATTDALYEELALSRKGVCRHRSYAFLITALRVGLPTRFVHNEAHAWVEVFDGRLWHRIDLGGAAGRVEYQRPPEVPLHRPPRDELPWPAEANPGLGAPGIQTSTSGGGAQSNPDGSNSGSSATPPGTGSRSDAPPRSMDSSPNATPPWLDRLSPSPSATAVAPSHATLDLGHQAIRRGHPLRVMGRLEAGGVACAFGRVDFALRTDQGRVIPLGSLPTDERGAYAGEVVVPADVPVGE